MKNRIKNIFLGLVCMSLLSVPVLPVRAGQYIDDIFVDAMATGCTHRNKKVDEWDVYTMLNEWKHNRVHHTRYTCIDCPDYDSNYEQDMGEEDHSLAYRDLGHLDWAHNYQIYCTKCSYSCITSIPCNNGGSHNTPW